nr:DUF1653 domain-containing protein [Butyrivibrio proteoclasticus]
MDRPRPQELYRHFKGNLYQIVTVATHSETREEMVVYQALYGDYRCYVRPLDMFMSDVDRVKYPDVKQKKRFEKIDPATLAPVQQPEVKKETTEAEMDRVVKPSIHIETGSVKAPEERPERTSVIKPLEPTEPSEYMKKTVDEEAEELNLDPLVIQFMDAELASDRLGILSKLRPIITNDMIDIMAMSVGVVINEGDVYDRYNDLRTCLATVEKFESNRLRS